MLWVYKTFSHTFLIFQKNSTTSLQQRKRKRLKICFGKAEQNAAAVAGANAAAGTGADVGGGVAGANMETNVGNSLSISNMREETEYSTSNFDSKSHATELTTASGEAEEVSGIKILNKWKFAYTYIAV